MAPRLAPLAWLLPAARRRGWLQALAVGVTPSLNRRSMAAVLLTVAACYRAWSRGPRLPGVVFPAVSELGVDLPQRRMYQFGFVSCGALLSASVAIFTELLAPHLLQAAAEPIPGEDLGAGGQAAAAAATAGGRARRGAHLRPGRRSARPQRPGRQAEDARGFRRKVAGGAPERSGEGGAAPELGRPQAGGRCGGSREAAVGQLPPLGALQRAGRRRAGGRHPRARALPAELRPLGRRRPLHGGRRAAREGLRGPLRGGRAEGRAPARPPEGGGGGEGPPRHPELLQHGAVPAPAGPAGVPRGRPSRERHDCRGRRVARGGPRGAECHGRGAVGHHPAFRRVLLHVRLRHVRRRRLAAARGLEEAPAPGAVLLAGLALRMPRPCLPPLPPPACSPSSRRGFHLELGSNSSSFAQGRIDVHSQALIRGL
ncbi:unnamed protein product [Prorocentrum cordatum]|uniref:Solute carrier family 40 protein n=1 Tax=Prorocentrum cordatum TaxID=2364126 RepID=A0ABN9SUR9_9DINO|nr:unnamed protein product [Polarella glacialis]